MKLKIMLGVQVDANNYYRLKGKKREILADLSDIVHTLSAANKCGKTSLVSILPDSTVSGYDLDIVAEEMAAVLRRCKAYRRDLALKMLEAKQ